MRAGYIFILISVSLYRLGSGPQAAAQEANSIEDSATVELHRAVREEREWVKVHAAESLLNLAFGNGVRSEFESELNANGNVPQYRVGILRILAQAADSRQERMQFVERIRDIYLDDDAIDRNHAAETLGKLRYEVPPGDRPRFEDLAVAGTDPAAPYRRWVLATAGEESDFLRLEELLASADAETRGNTAYVLRYLSPMLPPATVAKLEQLAKEEEASPYRVYVISAAYVATSDASLEQQFKEQLLKYVKNGNRDEKYEVAAALANRGSLDDLPVLKVLLGDEDADVRVGAANAILRLSGNSGAQFKALDWLVLAIYALGMMAIGWRYSDAQSTDEYLLGGREMKPWAVGISLFATLMSTLTYLAFPGEMIRHGPMILSTVLAYPFVYFVVGRYMIPYIMRLKVTSAYEILEMRFGLSVRMLGSAIFLVLRLFWMSLIVYATSDAVIVPLMGLSPSSTPWVCVVLATITVAYTSMGGLQAVIVTDVIQTFIMVAGAILSLALITYNLGGIAEWFPQAWSPSWDEPSLFGTESRVSVGTVILSVFVWYVCTAGSDQMAIQRYLSTKDAPAARKMFGISLLCDTAVTLILALLGLALFSFFSIHRDLLPAGETVSTAADKLLPLFVVKVLPGGIGGLVVAGILSAAMDSLSSGLNSSALVICEDWIDRFRRHPLGDMQRVAQVKVVSWMLGIAVVSISMFTSYVPGNLLEMCFKVVNLLTAPLFVLFFMAMFVPWATAVGTWFGGIASTVVAVAIAYMGLLGLGFIWIMPVSLLVGILTGCVVSLLPIGAARPMLNMSE